MLGECTEPTDDFATSHAHLYYPSTYVYTSSRMGVDVSPVTVVMAWHSDIPNRLGRPRPIRLLANAGDRKRHRHVYPQTRSRGERDSAGRGGVLASWRPNRCEGSGAGEGVDIVN